MDIPVGNCLNNNISQSMCSHNSSRHHSVATFLELMETTLAITRMKVLSQLIPSGTADAIRQYLWLLEEHNVMEFLILTGDHLYRMDYMRFIQVHRETDTDISVSALPMDEKRTATLDCHKSDSKQEHP